MTGFPDIRLLLPADVAVAQTAVDLDATLWPEEDAVVAAARPDRRAEFTTGRACARRALRELGIPEVGIPAGPRREPRWPAGAVGSITHCRGLRAAAVARTADVAFLGIDAEPNGPLPPGVAEIVALPGELDVSLASGIHLDRLLFSAKEAAFKAWHSGVGRYLDFSDIEVTVGGDGTFTARLSPAAQGALPPSLPTALAPDFASRGQWAATSTGIVTVVMVPNSASSTTGRL